MDVLELQNMGCSSHCNLNAASNSTCKRRRVIHSPEKLGIGNSKKNLQRINAGRWSNAYIACDSTGRLMEQYGNGLASRMADSPALIPLVGNNSRFNSSIHG